jgi:VWFA-related protein
MDRRSTSALLLMLALPRAQEKPPVTPPGRVEERVTVRRVVLTGRVIDKFANAIPGLARSDFRLRVDGAETAIESAEWIPARPAPAPGPARAPAQNALEPATEGVPQAPPRRIVLLFQWEIAGQKDAGFVRMMRQARRFLDTAGADDRVAVLGYGSNLRLLQDFTTDRAAVEEAIEKVRSPRWTGRSEDAAGPRLFGAAKGCGRTDSIERALLCIGNALAELPGPKTMLFFGWTAATTRETWRNEYPAILEAIGRAETSVSVLDVSDGKRVGPKPVLLGSLKSLAADTGGLYNETFDFPDLARLRVERSLDGSYELVFRGPAGGRGWHDVEITLAAREGTALFPRWYRDGPDVSSK